MRRILVMVLAFAVSLVAAIGIAARFWGDEATETGRMVYGHRLTLEGVFAPRPSVPLVVWLGDSTILGGSYPQIIADHMSLTDTVATRVLSTCGLDFYHYYFVMGPVVALRPDLIATVAHLRVFNVHRFDLVASDRTFNDLASMLPAAELLHAPFLPLSQRGLSLSELMLTRALRFTPVEDSLFFFEGLRSNVQTAALWSRLPHAEEPKPTLMSGIRAVNTILKSYDVPISRDQPVVRMMAATVRMASDGGIRTLVVASPIPHVAMGMRGWYDPALFQRRFDLLRDVVEENGGSFLDLHDVLDQTEFADAAGHYNGSGAKHLATVVEPVVRRMLSNALVARGAPGVNVVVQRDVAQP